MWAFVPESLALIMATMRWTWVYWNPLEKGRDWRWTVTVPVVSVVVSRTLMVPTPAGVFMSMPPGSSCQTRFDSLCHWRV